MFRPAAETSQLRASAFSFTHIRGSQLRPHFGGYSLDASNKRKQEEEVKVTQNTRETWPRRETYRYAQVRYLCFLCLPMVANIMAAAIKHNLDRKVAHAADAQDSYGGTTAERRSLQRTILACLSNRIRILDSVRETPFTQQYPLV
jgi:hypothetical protein